MRKYRSISGLVKVRWMIAVKARTSSRLRTQGFMRPCFSYRFSTLSLAMASSQPHSTISHKVGIFNFFSSGRQKLARSHGFYTKLQSKDNEYLCHSERSAASLRISAAKKERFFATLRLKFNSHICKKLQYQIVIRADLSFGTTFSGIGRTVGGMATPAAWSAFPAAPGSAVLR